MKTTLKIRKRRMAGFSLIEMLIAVTVLIIVMGSVFSQIAKSQKKYRSESGRVDLTQQSREFMDQIVRDLRQAGYPNSKMYSGAALNPALMSPNTSDSRNAVGLVSFSPTDIWFEGDVDGDGAVEYVRYTILTGAGGNCPCQLRRLQKPKVNATEPNAQTVSAADYSTGIDGVINSGDGAGNAQYALNGNLQFHGGAVAANTYFANYKTAPIFQAFDATGAAVPAGSYSAAAYTNQTGIYTIKTIVINLNVMADSGGTDLQNNMPSVTAMTASVRLLN
jgi:type II secretory pathway pseudopilin PulG